MNEAMDIQQLTRQLQQLQTYMQMLEEQIQDVTLAIENLDEITNVKKGTEIYAPLTSGVFVKATLATNQELLINVGNNIIVQKTPAEAQTILKGQLAELQEAQQGMVQRFSDLYQEYARVMTASEDA